MFHQQKKRLLLILLFASLNLHTTNSFAQSQAEVDCMVAVMRSCTWRLCKGDINCMDDRKSTQCANYGEFRCVGAGKDPAAVTAWEDAWLMQAVGDSSRQQQLGDLDSTDVPRQPPPEPEPENPAPADPTSPVTRQTPSSPADSAVEPWDYANDKPCGSVAFEANKYDCPDGYPQYILETGNSCKIYIRWRGAYYGSSGRAVEVALEVPPGSTTTHTPCCNGPYHKHLQCLDSAQGQFEPANQ